MTLDDEVVRVEQVEFLQGATGHGVASLLFLVGGAVAHGFGRPEIGWMTVVGAFLITANGLSIYAWDRLRDRFRTDDVEVSDGDGDDHDSGNVESGRTLQPHRLSSEMRAELAAGFVIVGTLVCFLVALTIALDYLRLQTIAYLLYGMLGVGNLAVLLRAYYG